jgi:hypothetical protein
MPDEATNANLMVLLSPGDIIGAAAKDDQLWGHENRAVCKRLSPAVIGCAKVTLITPRKG